MKEAGAGMWLFIIIFGVCIGNLMSNGITAIYIEYQANKALHKVNQRLGEEAKRSKERARESARQAAERSANQAAADRASREADPTGKELVRQCNEWSRQYANTPTSFVLQQRDAACRKSQRYVDTGVSQR